MTVRNRPGLWRDRYPWPDANSHKHARGRLGVVCGPPLSTGAARLAARAGLRMGAGLVRLFCAPDAARIVAPTVEAVMVEAFETPEALEALAADLDAVVIGPAAGLTERTRNNLRALSASGTRLVIDADALTLFRDGPDDLFDRLDADDVLTPHAGEFERLFPGLLSRGRTIAARQAAERCGAVVVLKGAGTVIAASDGRCAITGLGSPWLATAGTGDVLAGMIGGLMAQGMSGFDAACAGVWIHARAGRRLGPGLIAEDLERAIPPILRALWR